MSSAVRCAPVLPKAEKMRAGLLEAAAAVIAEQGYEAATLTDVAARASASIGSLYRYFPDKPAVARALADIYGREIAKRWEALAAAAASADLAQLVDRMVDLIFGYMTERPAFVPLLLAARDYKHAPADRDALRGHIASLLRTQAPLLEAMDALLVANIVVEIVKSLGALYGRNTSQRSMIVEELRTLLRSYLAVRLPSAQSEFSGSA